MAARVCVGAGGNLAGVLVWIEDVGSLTGDWPRLGKHVAGVVADTDPLVSNLDTPIVRGVNRAVCDLLPQANQFAGYPLFQVLRDTGDVFENHPMRSQQCYGLQEDFNLPDTLRLGSLLYFRLLVQPPASRRVEKTVVMYVQRKERVMWPDQRPLPDNK